MGVSLTETAAKHVSHYLESRGKGVGIRLAVKTTGCSGLMYVLEPVDEVQPEDVHFASQGVDVYIDPKSLVYVDGTQMDYVKQGLNEGFEFTNPNVAGECGCGESFTVWYPDPVDFNQSYFEILQLPVGFSVDQDVLTNHYREVQKSVHPDRFAGGSDREKRLAVQWATRVNEAYEVLKSPLKRAIYLLEMVEVELSDNPQLDSGFLIEQIDLRERLEEIEHESDALAKLDLFKKEVTQVVAELQSEFVTAYEAQNYPAATQVVYKVQFMNKLHVAAEHLEEKLLDY